MTASTLHNDHTLYFRTEVMTIPVERVIPGDWLFDMHVKTSDADDQEGIWKITGVTSDEEAGFVLRITEGRQIEVRRTRPVGDNECRSCGRTGVKYSARHLCNTCYQREYRASRS